MIFALFVVSPNLIFWDLEKRLRGIVLRFLLFFGCTDCIFRDAP